MADIATAPVVTVKLLESKLATPFTEVVALTPASVTVAPSPVPVTESPVPAVTPTL